VRISSRPRGRPAMLLSMILKKWRPHKKKKKKKKDQKFLAFVAPHRESEWSKSLKHEIDFLK